MNWNELATGFKNNITAFAFLITSSLVTGFGKIFAPPIAGLTVIAGILAMLSIALCYVFLKDRNIGIKKRIFGMFVIAFVVLLSLYSVLLFMGFIYDTGYSDGILDDSRRIRGYEYKNNDAKQFVENVKGGSIKDAIAGSSHEADRLFTEHSKVIMTVILFFMWVLGYSLLCSIVAIFSMLEFKANRRKKVAKANELSTDASTSE